MLMINAIKFILILRCNKLRVQLSEPMGDFMIKKRILIIFLSIILFGAGNFTAALPNFADEEFILFIVDFSNSMTEKLHGTTKINMVLDTMQEILPLLPPEKRVGLRVYGHKGGGLFPSIACSASSLIVPMTKNSAPLIQSALFSLKPTGWTPITYSLKQAVNSDFAGVRGKKRIILLTDGGENCDESPCDYVLELQKTRQDIYIDVIAFNINDQEANNQLKCTALVTSGKFYSANTAAELTKSLFNSLDISKEVQGVIVTH